MCDSKLSANILYNMDTYRLFLKSVLNIVGKIIKTIGFAMGCQPENQLVSACGHIPLKTESIQLC